MDEHILKEIQQRVTRIESRICRLGDALDVPLRSTSKGLKLISAGPTAATVEAPALDVALSEIVRFLTELGIQGKVVSIKYQGAVIATIYPKEQP